MSPIALPSHKVAVLHGAKDLRIEERSVWPPAANQAQVAVTATGLCGSDCESNVDNLTPCFLTFTYSALLHAWSQR